MSYNYIDFGDLVKRYLANEKRFTWNLTCQDGEHIIKVDRPNDLKRPIDLWIDGQHVSTIQYNGSKITPYMKYPFECGGEQILMVMAEGKIDLVYRGHFVKRGWEYFPKHRLSARFVGIMMLVCLAPLLLFAFPLPWTTSDGLAFAAILTSLTSLSFAFGMFTTNKSRFATPQHKKRKLILLGCASWLCFFLNYLLIGVLVGSVL